MPDCSIYTDGGCRGNPGPGGWAFIIHVHSQTIARHGAEPATTNNRMELCAVIAALRFLSRTPTVTCRSPLIYTDSQYVELGITDWIRRWIANGWRTASKKAVQNRDLWQHLWNLSSRYTPQWCWLRGHVGHADNENCHRLVHSAIDALIEARAEER